jgi:hypothetical protein
MVGENASRWGRDDMREVLPRTKGRNGMSGTFDITPLLKESDRMNEQRQCIENTRKGMWGLISNVVCLPDRRKPFRARDRSPSVKTRHE